MPVNVVIALGIVLWTAVGVVAAKHVADGHPVDVLIVLGGGLLVTAAWRWRDRIRGLRAFR